MENIKNELSYFTITGASGRLGSLILKSLLDLVPASQIIATTRYPEKLTEIADRGVNVRYADFNKPETLPDAFFGTTRILIISTDSADAKKRLTQVCEAVKAALKVNVSHITIISATNANENSLHPLLKAAWETELFLSHTGTDWTALRLNIWMDGILYLLKQLKIDNQFVIPEGAGKPCWITKEDCARVAAYILSGKSLIKGVVELTGPDALGLKDLAVRWSEIHKSKPEIIVLPDDALIERLKLNGLTETEAKGIVGAAGWILRNENVFVNDNVERITGLKPTSVDEMLSKLVF